MRKTAGQPTLWWEMWQSVLMYYVALHFVQGIILSGEPRITRRTKIFIMPGWMSWFGNSMVIFILHRQRGILNPTDYLTFNLAVSDASVSVFGYSRGIIEIFNVFRDDGFLITSIWTCQVDGFLTLLFGLASINTLAMISVTRYIKGCHPHRGKNLFTNLNKADASFWQIYSQ
ncbi:opsin-5-like [Ornithorhynchus anatinus]|uniref:opsin-5-like n=1 Tax=Ornithorhynchus anatinus TaxID=9258 RepID=UPI0019D4D1F0|nr:opsin-5-like [Ornithorhynchus anatinus]